MPNGDKLPVSDGQRNHSFIADVEESLASFAFVRCPLRFVLESDESNSQRSDPRMSATGDANGVKGTAAPGRTACRRQNAIRRRRPRSVDSVVVEVCTTMLTSPEGARLPASAEGLTPFHKLAKDAGLTERPLSKFYRTAHHAGLVIHLMKKAKPVNPFERMRHSKSDADLDLLMGECCLDEECTHH